MTDMQQDMEADLMAAGWSRASCGHWASPTGDAHFPLGHAHKLYICKRISGLMEQGEPPAPRPSYQIVKAVSSADLARLVQEQINLNEGWELVGGICSGDMAFYQAMRRV